MVDSGTGQARRASSRPSTGTVTRRVAGGQWRGVGRHPRRLRFREGRDHHVGACQGDPAVGGQAVVGDALVAVARVGERDAQRRDRAAAQGRGGVDGLAGRDAGVAPPGAGAQVAWALGHDRDVRADGVPGGEQAASGR